MQKCLLLTLFHHWNLLVSADVKNVLLLVADDLRPALGCYGAPVSTPNIDQLASRGFLFSNAFAQQALCGPSRTSFLTSRRPDSLLVYNNEQRYWRKHKATNFTTLPQYFKENGYETVSAGKVFHPGSLSGKTDDWPFSWSRKPYHPPTQRYKQAKVCPGPNGTLERDIVCPVNLMFQPGGTLPDLQTTDFAVKFLLNRNESGSKKPFFLAVGLHKPHIPLKYPKEFKRIYPFDNITIAPNHQVPHGLPPVAWNPWTDLRERDDVRRLNPSFPYGPLPRDYQKSMRQSYFASISYVDYLVGWILSSLDASGFAKNTVVVFVSDHGWSLGEHGEWSKYSNFGVALRIPLIVFDPSLTPSFLHPFPYKSPFDAREHKNIPPPFKKIDSFIELVDLFPTLVDSAGLPPLKRCPKMKLIGQNSSTNHRSSFVPTCSEGTSFFSLLTRNHSNKSQSSKAPHRISQSATSKLSRWKKAVFAQYPRPALLPQLNSDQPRLGNIKIMGYTIRTRLHHFTAWIQFKPSTGPNWKKVYALELYLLKNDRAENHNQSANPRHKRLVKKLFKMLKAGWRRALPPRSLQ